MIIQRNQRKNTILFLLKGHRKSHKKTPKEEDEMSFLDTVFPYSAATWPQAASPTSVWEMEDLLCIISTESI